MLTDVESGEFDHDSSISFDDDEDSTASQEDDFEDWIEYIQSSAREADEKMLTYNITKQVETQNKLTRQQAFGIATQCPGRWTRRAAERNPGLIISTRTQRKAARPAKRWEDDLNEFVKDGETEATQNNDMKNNNTWLIAAKNVCEWEKKDNTLNTLPTIEEPNPTAINNITTPTTPTPRRKTQCFSWRCPMTSSSLRSSFAVVYEYTTSGRNCHILLFFSQLATFAQISIYCIHGVLATEKWLFDSLSQRAMLR